MTNFKNFKFQQNFRNTAKNSFKQNKNNFNNNKKKENKMTNFRKGKINFKLFLAVIIISFITSINVYSQWTPVNGGQTYNLYSVEKINQQVLVASGTRLVMRSVNGGLNWTQININTQADLYYLSFWGNDGVTCGGHPSSFAKTTDGGLSWNNFTINTDIWGQYLATGGISSMKMVNYNTLIISYYYYNYNILQTVYGMCKSTNLGANWSTLSAPSIQTDYINESTGFSTSGSKIYRTTDGGSSWVQRYNFQNESCSKTCFINENTGYVTISNSSNIYKTTDGGLSWTLQILPSNSNVIRSINFLNPGFGIAVGESGTIFRTTNGGTNWVLDNNPTADKLNDVVITAEGNAVAVGENGRILKYTSITGINVTGNEIPASFSLSQNYPNPFNPATKISFDIPSESNVKIEVYDITGKKIEELVNENMKAGSYEVDWNASKISSGTYFYRMQAGSFIETKKMILVK